jgi:hypothetical protein
MVERYFGTEDPLGKTIELTRWKNPPASLPDATFEIVGVVEDVRNQDEASNATTEPQASAGGPKREEVWVEAARVNVHIGDNQRRGFDRKGKGRRPMVCWAGT